MEPNAQSWAGPEPIISGIQQIGLGNKDVYETFAWYHEHLGMDVRIFDEEASAELMLPYTGGKPRRRHAILALNLQGGGGLEIWKHTSRTPLNPTFELQLGDLGLYMAKFKALDIEALHTRMTRAGLSDIQEITTTPDGRKQFFLSDLNGNILQIQSVKESFTRSSHPAGGVHGCSIGVTDMDRSVAFYKNILGYDQVLYDASGTFEDWGHLPGGNQSYRRVGLTHSQARKGAFSRLLGTSEIELIQALDREGQPIYKDRFWGDPGYIHLCFDIQRMDVLREKCAALGHPFTVDSSDSFDMGEAAGHFSYIEDPDGTLIEFVETHKVPILKKFNLYLNLQKRNPEKPLPNWMVKALGFNRVKSVSNR